MQGRESLYPAGYVYLANFRGEGPLGGDYSLRVLFVTRGSVGYVLICGSPPDRTEEFLLPFEGIMRSFHLS
jgi:hypothetical protein